MSVETDRNEPPRLDKVRHVKYWARCLKTFLPQQYTSNDSNRMYLAYLTLSALELLDSLNSLITAAERSGYTDWIYRCQHPNGGFRMWPGTDFGDRATHENAKWDPANVPATYFALGSLLVLGDDLGRVKIGETLRWLHGMQRSDGSFGETLVDGRIEGGRDPRFAYCAVGARYILRGGRPNGSSLGDDPPDIDIEGLVRCIQLSESFDGGFADNEYHEPHAGYTFCSLGALALSGRLQTGDSGDSNDNVIPFDQAAILRWLAERQTDLLDPDASLDSEFMAKASNPSNSARLNVDSDPKPTSLATDLHQSPDKSTLWSVDASLHSYQDIDAGMNGRTNKVADTCYCWWVAASLKILRHGDLFHHRALRNYLLKLTQHPYMGGFCKFPGDKYADLYHSFLGLAALSLSSTEDERSADGIKEWDAEMCVSADVRSRLKVIWKRLEHDRIA